MRIKLSLALLFSLTLGSELMINGHHQPPVDFAADVATQRAAAAQQGSRRRARRAKKRRACMPQSTPPPKPDAEPTLDAPNRMEIDPGDLPPSERNTPPWDDRRTKIPEGVDPDDMAPREKTPPTKNKKP